MPQTLPAVAAAARVATRRRYVMCPPEHFDVTYAINPWMDPTTPVDRDRAREQWQRLHDTYVGLGHTVDVLDAVPGLPDMVFTANGALVVDGRALVARFAYEQRAAESDHHLTWLRENVDPHARRARTTNEAEGDLLVAGDVVLAGSGFRTDPRSHVEVAEFLGREVVGCELVDPRFYHLDVALAVLDDRTLAWYPPAFSAATRAELRRRFPDLVEVCEQDALVLGCNAVSDGRNVVLDERATRLADDLAARGFSPVPLAIDEFNLAGGGIKCLTMEVRPRPGRCGTTRGLRR